MKVVIQRVKEASVTVEDKVIGAIHQGYLLYVCFEASDKVDVIEKAIKKILALRIFEDENGKMNKDITQVNGGILSISQFTLSWDGRKGNRPSFELSMPPAEAQIFYQRFNEELKKSGLQIEIGAFGADMKVQSINDGPVTFHLSF